MRWRIPASCLPELPLRRPITVPSSSLAAAMPHGLVSSTGPVDCPSGPRPTETCMCLVWGLGPVYRRHPSEARALLQIWRCQITYFNAGGRVATMVREMWCMSAPCFGSWVKSRAQTMPSPFGLWSELLDRCAASPLVPSDFTDRPGAIRSISPLRTSRLRAARQPLISTCYYTKQTLMIN
jgi:hypothetical protein